MIRSSAFLTLLTVLAVSTSCSLVPTLILPSPKAHPESQASPQLMKVFEQRIAQKLITEMPTISPARTLLETELLVERLKELTYHSGLNRKLLTAEQRSQLARFDILLQALQFEVQHWHSKNHLAVLNYLDVEGFEIKPDVVLKTVEANVRSQISAGVVYPRPLVQAALRQLRQLPNTETSQSVLKLLETQEFSNGLDSWQRGKLEAYFDPAELPKVLARLEALVTNTPSKRQYTEELLVHPARELYSDPHYDIRLESDPEQLTLDIVSLHLEEALRFSQRLGSATIIGVEASFPQLLNVSHEKLLVDLEAIMSRPAFEFQSLAYQAAGEMLSDYQWAFNWQRTLALAYGQWTLNLMTTENYYLDRESRLGLDVQQDLFTELAVIELKLALSEWTYEEARSYLVEVTPYNLKQVDRILTQLLAEDGSYAAAALISDRLSEHLLNEHSSNEPSANELSSYERLSYEQELELIKIVSDVIASGYPDSLEEFLARINEVAVPTRS